MSAILRIPRTVQPQRAVGISRENPVGAHIRSLILPPVGPTDVALPSRAITKNANCNTESSVGGIAYSSTDGNSGLVYSGGWGSVVPVTSNITFFACVYVSVLGVRRVLLADWNAAGAGQSCAIEVLATNQWRMHRYDGSAAVTGGTVTVGWHTIVGSYRPDGGGEMWIDGVSVGVMNGFTARPTGGTAKWLDSGAYVGGLGWSTNKASLMAVCEMFANSGIATSFHKNPWQVFTPETKRIWSGITEAKVRGPKLLTRVRTTQPQYPAQIDKENPLTQGIAMLSDVGNASSQPAIVGTKIVPRQLGLMRGYGATDGVGATDKLTAETLSANSTGVSLLFIAAQNSAVSATRLFSLNDSHVYTQAATQNLTFALSGGAPFWTTPALTTRPTVNVITYAGGTSDPLMWRDGVAQTVTYGSGTRSGTVAAAAAAMQIGNRTAGDRVYDGSIGLFVWWNRILTDAEARSLSQNPWQILSPVETPIWLTEGVNGVFALPAIDLNSAAAGAASATAALTTAIALAATPAAVAAMTATLAGDTSLAATPASQASATAALTTAIQLAAAAATLATAPSALSTGIVLAATPAALAAASAGLTTTIVLTAAPAALATVTAALMTAVQLTAAPAAVASVTAALTTTPSGIAAAPASLATATAALTTAISLAAAPTAVSVASSALTTEVRLAAAPATLAASTAALTTAVRLATVPTTLAAASGALTTAISLASAPAALVTASAALTAPGSGLAATPEALATATASLTTGIRLGAAAQASATATANLLTAVMLSSSAQVQAQSTANLTAPGATWSTATVVQAIAAANLTTRILLAAQAGASASGTSSLTVNSAPPFSPSPATASWVAKRKPRNWVVYGE